LTPRAESRKVSTYDLAVIGTGQGGVPLALDAAKRGQRVVVFERGKLGGCCVNVGCTPSKAFLASAHAAGRARRASAIGVHADVRVDFPAVMERVRATIADWNSGVEDHFAQSSATLVRAQASFHGPHELLADGELYAATNIVIDTGGHPALPTLAGLSDVPYVTSDTIWDLTTLPKRTIVLGGGYIGLELGQGLARCGSKVHIVDVASRVMANEEADVSDVLARSFARDGMHLHLSQKAKRVSHDAGVITLTLEDGSAIQAEMVLVATGRVPNIPEGVAQAGIALTERGFVQVDEHLTTTAPGVYALGDCAGQPQFTHVSWEDFRRLKAILAGDLSRTRSDRVLGYAAYTDPQLGRVGLTLDAAKQAGFHAKAVTIALEDVARAIEWGETDGFYRMVVDNATDAILGATLVGYEAGELVHVFLAHMEAHSTWRTLEGSVHIHPTYSEAFPTLARKLLT
jgi:pyruvate/2-oxoglutarate dehydrogenase complex dihydrolipoamide dehydrogenase (E3) component